MQKPDRDTSRNGGLRPESWGACGGPKMSGPAGENLARPGALSVLVGNYGEM